MDIFSSSPADSSVPLFTEDGLRLNLKNPFPFSFLCGSGDVCDVDDEANDMVDALVGCRCGERCGDIGELGAELDECS